MTSPSRTLSIQQKFLTLDPLPESKPKLTNGLIVSWLQNLIYKRARMKSDCILFIVKTISNFYISKKATPMTRKNLTTKITKLYDKHLAGKLNSDCPDEYAMTFVGTTTVGQRKDIYIIFFSKK